jgi:hypothetical protein
MMKHGEIEMLDLVKNPAVVVAATLDIAIAAVFISILLWAWSDVRRVKS